MTAKKIISENGAEKIEITSTDAFDVNDMIQLNSGDRIPLDGVIIEGKLVS